MTRVCFAFMAALLCLACGKDVAAPPALPHAVAAPAATPSVDVAEPSVVAPAPAPSDPAAAPAYLAPAPVAQARADAIKRPTAAANDSPTRPQTPAAGVLEDVRRPAAPDDAQALLLRATGGCTRMRCGPDHPCCNSCLSTHWRPVQGAGMLQRPDGKVLRLGGKELPICSWGRGQCDCAYDLRVAGEAQGDQFVITDVVEVPRISLKPGVPDAPPSFSAAWFLTLLQERERSLEFCFDRQKRRKPTLAPGVLVVRIVVTPEGRVQDPKVTSDSVGDATVADCITGLLQRLRASSAPVTAQSFEVHVPLGSNAKDLSIVAL